MSKPARIPVLRTWTERHAHKSIKLSEDEQGRIWIRLQDLRQWMPGLTNDLELHKAHPSRVAIADETTSPYLEASAFGWLTQKSTSPPTLKLRAWLESDVVGPARKRHQWEDYRGRDPLRHHRDFGPPRAETARATTEVRMPWESKFNPLSWLITQGQWSQRTTLIAGAVGAFLGVLISIKLASRAWDVENSYRLWSWIAIVVATWAVLWNAAWGAGAIRSASRIGLHGEQIWRTSSWLVVNLVLALLAVGLTLSNSKTLVESWWIMFTEGDPPVRVLVGSLDAEGKPQRLLVSGAIGMGSTKALRAVLEQYPGVSEIELNSPGGMVVEGHGMTLLLSGMGVKTVVNKECASACTTMFLAGEERVIGPKASLGFHRSYSIAGDFGSGWSETDYREAAWMRARGVKDDFIKRALDTPGYSIWEPPAAVLIDAGVVTGVEAQ